MRSLFGRVTRFVPALLRDPAEERLTEAFAAALEAAPALSVEFVDRWAQRYREGRWAARAPRALGTVTVVSERRATRLDRSTSSCCSVPSCSGRTRIAASSSATSRPWVDWGQHRLLLVALRMRVFRRAASCRRSRK